MTLIPTAQNPMLLFGCGNMGRAMLDGWLRCGIEPAAFVVVDPHAHNLPAGVVAFDSADATDRTFSIALLAIKPQIFGEAATHFERLLTVDATVLSLLAGTTVAALQEKLPGRIIVRIMPNLAAAIGKSPVGIYTEHCDRTNALCGLLQPLGTPCMLTDEGLMNAATALAGSGPAFVYRFIEALAKAGASLGLDPEQALQLAKAMVYGASELAILNDASPEELARRVTSPGGTTAAGLSVLDADAALESLIIATLTAAHNRGVELSKA